MSEFKILNSAFKRMKPLKHLLVNVVVNGAVLYAIVYYIPEL